MKILNIEVNFDFLDADDLERFENEAQKVTEECSKSNEKELSHSQLIREECRIIDNFFNNVFGDGTADKLFKGKSNLNEHIKAFEDIANQKIAQQTSLKNTLERYQPNKKYNKYQKR